MPLHLQLWVQAALWPFGSIVGGHMVQCDTLERVCGGLSLEDRFFEIYKETAGDEE